MKIFLWLILSIVSGTLYRMGGSNKWNTKWRDLGVPCIVTVYMMVLGIKAPIWAFMLHFGLLFGALTAYWGLDERKWGYWAHGLGLSLAALPIAFTTGHWIGFMIRTVVLTASITIWSELCKRDVIEEAGRGVFITLSLPILLI